MTSKTKHPKPLKVSPAILNSLTGTPLNLYTVDNADERQKYVEVQNRQIVALKKQLSDINESDTQHNAAIEKVFGNSVELSRQVQKLKEKLKLGRTNIKPATAFIKIAIENNINIKPAHKELQKHILIQAMKHPDVVKRDKKAAPLEELEEKYFVSLLNRIYGGCVIQLPFLATFKELEEFTLNLFKRPELSHIRVGCIVDFLTSKCQKILDMARLARNTIRKVIKRCAPQHASRRGRGGISDKEMLRQYVIDELGLIPLEINYHS